MPCPTPRENPHLKVYVQLSEWKSGRGEELSASLLLLYCSARQKRPIRHRSPN